jgi:hypothetical protein
LYQLNSACHCSLHTWSTAHPQQQENASTSPSTSGLPSHALAAFKQHAPAPYSSRGFAAAAAASRNAAFRDNAYQRFQQLAQEYKQLQQQITGQFWQCSSQWYQLLLGSRNETLTDFDRWRLQRQVYPGKAKPFSASARGQDN